MTQTQYAEEIIAVLYRYPDMAPAIMRHIPKRLLGLKTHSGECDTLKMLELYHWLKKADKQLVKQFYRQARHLETLFA